MTGDRPFLLTAARMPNAIISVGAAQKKANTFNHEESAAGKPKNQPPPENVSIWYIAPASHRNEALPIENGLPGAMECGEIRMVEVER